MTRHITLRVTQDHIDRGEPESPWACPIALALDDAGFTSPRVGGFNWRATVPGRPANFARWARAPLPKRARDFIVRFDKGKPVKPTTLRLPLPPELQT